MRKEFRYLSVVAILGMAYFLGRGLQTLYQRSLPAEKLMRRLGHLSLTRKKEGFQGKQAVVISLHQGSKVILVGDVFGNYESLMQIRNDLVNKGLLSQADRLTKGTYLILMGPFLGQTYTNGQVLEWLARMMNNNPDAVWFLRSQDDAGEKIRDLSLFARALSFDQKRMLNAWYATLPLAVYLLAENLSEPPFRITPFGADSTIFDRIACRKVEGTGPVKALCKLNALCSYVEGSLTGTLDTDNRTIDWATMKGLQGSPTAWHLISCPSRDYMQLYGYNVSAYAVITMGKDIASSSITSYYAPSGSVFDQGLSFLLGKTVKAE